MSNNKEKSNNIKSEENKILMYKTELDFTLHNKLLQNRYARNALKQELIKFKLSLIEWVSANKRLLQINEKEIKIF